MSRYQIDFLSHLTSPASPLMWYCCEKLQFYFRTDTYIEETILTVKLADGKIIARPDRPAFLISSTSWTGKNVIILDHVLIYIYYCWLPSASFTVKIVSSIYVSVLK
jgi:hypothetical protein